MERASPTLKIGIPQGILSFYQNIIFSLNLVFSLSIPYFFNNIFGRLSEYLYLTSLANCSKLIIERTSPTLKVGIPKGILSFFIPLIAFNLSMVFISLIIEFSLLTMILHRKELPSISLIILKYMSCPLGYLIVGLVSLIFEAFFI